MKSSKTEVVSNIGPFEIKRRKKNGFRQLERGAYPRMYVKQGETAIEAVATNKLNRTKMVRRDSRSNDYLITMGFGKRNTWFENDCIAQGDVIVCKSAEEALLVLNEILKAAKAGAFDDALENLREQRQQHAQMMIEARDHCGFHRRRKHDGQELLPAPSGLSLENLAEASH